METRDLVSCMYPFQQPVKQLARLAEKIVVTKQRYSYMCKVSKYQEIQDAKHYIQYFCKIGLDLVESRLHTFAHPLESYDHA